MSKLNIKVCDFEPLESHLKAGISFETLLFSKWFILLIYSAAVGHCAYMKDCVEPDYKVARLLRWAPGFGLCVLKLFCCFSVFVY